MPKCYLMVGPPCSGKSTYTKNLSEGVLSCDIIRGTLFGKSYVHSNENEELVWKTFHNQIDVCVQLRSSFVVDNTNCRQKYISNITARLTEDYEVIYVWFDTPMWKLKFRNYKRWLFTGKLIPRTVIEHMQRNYKNLKSSYYPSVKTNSTVIKN